ncbi:MAG TPA: hypothetical protein VGR35_09635 [Tepidisphaeraceae bacterium]|nr:hypothetical protein [Tepidisphaeraceae bacterium]
MAIRAISRQEFNAKDPTREPLATMLADERGWFADDAGNIVGVVLFDKTDKDWAWVMLGRDPKGKFRAINTNVSLESQEDAQKDLMAKMAEVEKSGETTFEQD